MILSWKACAEFKNKYFVEDQAVMWSFLQGRLTVGAALLGSPHVIGVDIDEAALDTCQENLEEFEDLPVRFATSPALR